MAAPGPSIVADAITAPPAPCKSALLPPASAAENVISIGPANGAGTVEPSAGTDVSSSA